MTESQSSAQEMPIESHVQFANQLAVLDELLRDAPKLGVLEAPPTCGKSHLLRQCEQKFHDRGWRTIFLDLAVWPYQRPTIDGFIELFLRKLPEVKPELLTPQQFVQTLIGYIAPSDNPPFILLIDHVDHILTFNNQGHPIMTSFARWLCSDLIRQVTSEFQNSDKACFGCILTGRHASTIAQESDLPISGLQKYSLRPVNFDALRRTIENRICEVGGSRPSSKIDLLTRGIHAIGGGHPGIQANLIKKAEEECKFWPTDEYFNDRRRLFSSCAYDTYKSLINNLCSEVGAVYPYLSLFRCLNLQIIEDVLQWCRDNKPETLFTEMTSEDVLKELFREKLLAMDNRSYMWTDGILRRLSALEMRLNHQSDASEIGKRALRWYREQVRNSTNQFGFYRAPMLSVEHLYHLTVSLADRRIPSPLSKQSFRKCLERDLLYLRPKMNALGSLESTHALKQFLQTLAQDRDLDEEIRKIVPNENAEEWLQPWLKPLYEQHSAKWKPMGGSS